MAPSTRTIAGSSNGENVNDSTKRYVDEALAVIRSMEEMLNFKLQNQVVNSGANRTKVEFLKFSGYDVRGWIFRCEQFFIIDTILDDDQKVWYSFNDHMAELKNVKYESSAKEYQDKFDDLLSRKNRIQMGVGSDTYGSNSSGNNSSGNNNSNTKPLLFLPSTTRNWNNKPTTVPHRRQLTQKEYEEKRVKNLCFYRDKKFVPSQKCKGDIKCNFKELKMEFHNNRKVDLRGTHMTAIQWVEEEDKSKNDVSPELLQVVEEFNDVFEIPTELPPKRTRDHKIPLVEGNEDASEKVCEGIHHLSKIQARSSGLPWHITTITIPNRIWESISMDIIEGLPKSQGHNVIFVVVDILTKYAHSMQLTHPFTAAKVAQLFLDAVYKLHGLPTTIVSDREDFS
ncbi:retrotransposable element Tf2 [Tanacetum coccineum]